MKKISFLLVIFVLLSSATNAQYAAQKEAAYMATLKAVTDYKINDEDNLRNVEDLRENERFKRDLMKMLSKLSNSHTKNSTNIRVYKILLKAGKDIYNELN